MLEMPTVYNDGNLASTKKCKPVSFGRVTRHISAAQNITIGLFYSILSCVLPLQEVALCQSPPSFSVLCYPRPYRSLFRLEITVPVG